MTLLCGNPMQALLKNVLDIFIAVGMGQMDTYQHDFEDSLLTETAAYYKRKVRRRLLQALPVTMTCMLEFWVCRR